MYVLSITFNIHIEPTSMSFSSKLEAIVAQIRCLSKKSGLIACCPCPSFCESKITEGKAEAKSSDGKGEMVPAIPCLWLGLSHVSPKEYHPLCQGCIERSSLSALIVFPCDTMVITVRIAQFDFSRPINPKIPSACATCHSFPANICQICYRQSTVLGPWCSECCTLLAISRRLLPLSILKTEPTKLGNTPIKLRTDPATSPLRAHLDPYIRENYARCALTECKGRVHLSSMFSVCVRHRTLMLAEALHEPPKPPICVLPLIHRAGTKKPPHKPFFVFNILIKIGRHIPSNGALIKEIETFLPERRLAAEVQNRLRVALSSYWGNYPPYYPGMKTGPTIVLALLHQFKEVFPSSLVNLIHCFYEDGIYPGFPSPEIPIYPEAY